MNKQILPSKPGQVVAIWVSDTHIPKEYYVLCEKPNNTNLPIAPVKVCSISELQKSSKKKIQPEPEYIHLRNLYVVADSLVDWVKTWEPFW